MLSLDECLDYAALDREEIRALAQRHGLTEIAAAELGECLLETDAGTWVIRRSIIECAAHAERLGHAAEAAHWRRVLGRFTRQHPGYDLRPGNASG